MELIVFFIGTSNFLLVSQNKLYHIIYTWKKNPKNIPKIMLFLKVGDEFNYENINVHHVNIKAWEKRKQLFAKK
jgi:hypothetical protein